MLSSPPQASQASPTRLLFATKRLGLGAIHHANDAAGVFRLGADGSLWGGIFSVTNGYEVEINEAVSVSRGLRVGVHLPVSKSAMIPVVGAVLGARRRDETRIRRGAPLRAAVAADMYRH